VATRPPLKKVAPDDDVLVETFIDTSLPVKPAEGIGREKAEAEKAALLRRLDLEQKSARAAAEQHKG